MDEKIQVYLNKKIGNINKNIYGHFIEHLGRCIYGGIYEEGSPLSDENGFRKDVLDAIKRIRVPVLRWPGGNFASNYHWEDGIGEKEKRPRRFDTAWSAIETNHFGTHEFIKYCQIAGAEPYICLNLGTGTLDESLAWVEYCNSNRDTHFVNMRKQNGCDEPFRVKYWGIGNEIYGKWQHGYCSAAEYGEKAREFSQFIKKIDPDIKTIAVGANNPDWDLEVLKRCGHIVDYISIHIYLNPNKDNFYDIVAASSYIEERLKLLKSVIDVAGSFLSSDKEIQIAFDEWNIWRKASVETQMEEPYNLADSIFACGVFNSMHRLCNSVTMANLAQLVNVLGAISTSKDDILLNTIYWAFYLYSNYMADTFIESVVDSENFSTDFLNLKNIPYIDASATIDEKNKILCLAVINRHKDNNIQAKIDAFGGKISGNARIFELNGKTPFSFNTFEEKQNVRVIEKKPLTVDNRFSYVFPAHSTTVIQVKYE